MPVTGNSFASFGLYPDMEEAEHRILEAGIPLIQMVYPKPMFFDHPVHGMFGVCVTAPDPDSSKQAPAVNWHNAGNAYSVFKVKSKNGLAVAWVPDDWWMHNRVVLMTHPKWVQMIKQERLPDGSIISAAEVAFELKITETVLMQPVEIFNVFRDGKAECSFVSKKLAQEYIDDQGRTEVKYDPKTGTMLPFKVRKSQYTIETAEKWVWKPVVKAMIDREKTRHRFGWTECDEFKTKWKPLILATIKEKRQAFAEANESTDAADLAAAIENMPDEAILAFQRRLAAMAKNKKQFTPNKEEIVT